MKCFTRSQNYFPGYMSGRTGDKEPSPNSQRKDCAITGQWGKYGFSISASLKLQKKRTSYCSSSLRRFTMATNITWHEGAVSTKERQTLLGQKVIYSAVPVPKRKPSTQLRFLRVSLFGSLACLLLASRLWPLHSNRLFYMLEFLLTDLMVIISVLA